MIKIVFLGTPYFAVPTLKALAEDEQISVQLVITQRDKPVGRKGEITPPPVKVAAEELGIAVVQPDDVNQNDILKMVSEVEPDFIVVVAYGQILRSRWLDLAKKEILNVHASLLPRWRGASPIQSAILAGDEKTGVSIMGIRKKMDTGPVYAQEEISIEKKHAGELFEELASVGADLLLKVLAGFENFTPKKQDDSAATYCKKITRKSGEVSLENPEIMRKYRAYWGWPGIFTYLDGKRLKITEMEAGEIKKVQLEGKREMEIEEFKRGNPGFELP